MNLSLIFKFGFLYSLLVFSINYVTSSLSFEISDLKSLS
jgi:hypothetical protein